MDRESQGRSTATERTCVRCIMDTTDPAVTFDAAGVCNHCRQAERQLRRIRLSAEESRRRLTETAARIAARRNKDGYDSIIGLSGGVDSSYVAWLAHSLGLRPLAVHLDNGWNSEIAVSNIHSIVEHCKFDLVTVVIDWREFRDLQRAFIKAGVLDIEMLSDHAITAAMYRIARERGIKTVLSGTNIATEHGMPRAWVWNKQDLTNILDIHRRFGEVPLKTFPRLGLIAATRARYFDFEFAELLDDANYRRGEAVEILQREIGWRDYGGKHHESTFTRFYQTYVLPTKFRIDKRKPHLSALIRNGELSREQALTLLDEPLYPPGELLRERQFVLKKLGFTAEEFDRLMAEPPVPHRHYRSDYAMRRLGAGVMSLIRRNRRPS